MTLLPAVHVTLHNIRMYRLNSVTVKLPDNGLAWWLLTNQLKRLHQSDTAVSTLNLRAAKTTRGIPQALNLTSR